MNKQTYLSELEKYLKRLPEKDYQEAIAYFTEYFEDAGPEQPYSCWWRVFWLEPHWPLRRLPSFYQGYWSAAS